MIKNIIIGFGLIIIIVLVSFKYFDNKKVEINNSASLNNTRPIILDNIPFQFDLPQGYSVSILNRYEGGYELTLNVGKVLQDNSLYNVAPTIYLQEQIVGDRVYKPREYIDLLIENSDQEINKSKVMELFGNKAISGHSEADGMPIVNGYLKGSQLPASFNGKDYLITIDGTTYGTSKEFNQELFDLVVSSIKIKQTPITTIKDVDVISSLPVQAGLPSIVEAKRQAIYKAAISKDYEKLVAEADISVRNMKSSEGPRAGFIRFLNNADQKSKDTAFRIIPLLLKTSYAIYYPGLNDDYIWPSVAQKPATEWTSEEIAQLKTFMTDQEIEDTKLGGSGYYAYYRLIITKDGKWTLFVVGD